MLGIALPQLRMTLVERDGERCGFLRRAIEALGLDNIGVEQRRVEAWPEGMGKCDLVTSRRLGRHDTIIGIAAPLLAPGAAVVLFGRERTHEGNAAAERAATAAGLTLHRILPVMKHHPSGELFESEGRVLLYVKQRPGGGDWPPPDAPRA